MVLNALWPLLANARPAASPVLFEICTAAGIQLPGDGSSPADSADRHLKPHCALCSTGADKAPAVAGATGLPPARVELRGQLSALTVLPEPGRQSHSPAQPRAPPSLS